MLQTIFLATFSILIFLLLRWFFSPYFRYRYRNQTKDFKLFDNGKPLAVGSKPFLLDELTKEAIFDLTLVVPAYNEEQRLPTMMKETLEYFETKIASGLFKKIEIVIVDDGSSDKTLELIK